MGTDFIKKTKATWKKGWSRERQKLAIAQLFSASPQRAQAIEVCAFKTSEFSEGEPYEVQVEEGRLFVYKQGQSIGVCTTPPWNVLREVAASGGKTLGALHKVGKKEGQVEVLVLLPERPAVRSAAHGHIQAK